MMMHHYVDPVTKLQDVFMIVDVSRRSYILLISPVYQHHIFVSIHNHVFQYIIYEMTYNSSRICTYVTLSMTMHLKQ